MGACLLVGARGIWGWKDKKSGGCLASKNGRRTLSFRETQFFLIKTCETFFILPAFFHICSLFCQNSVDVRLKKVHLIRFFFCAQYMHPGGMQNANTPKTFYLSLRVQEFEMIRVLTCCETLI